MKFEEIKNLNVQKKQYSQKQLKSDNYNNIKKVNRYDNLAIILMNAEKKGALYNLSTLINDGEIACSWTGRITFNKDEWMFSLIPHTNADKNNIFIHLFNEINKEFKDIDEIYVNGSSHIVFLKTNSKKHLEKIINHVIDVFSSNEIIGISSIPINKKFILNNSKKEYTIDQDYTVKNKTKNKIKNKTLISCLENKNLSDNDKNRLSKLQEKFNNDEYIDIEVLNDLSNKYCSDKERLQIAIKFMS